jgi:hypothetical protein
VTLLELADCTGENGVEEFPDPIDEGVESAHDPRMQQ